MPSFENKGTYLLATVGGAYSLEVFMSIIHEVAERCQKEKLKKVLIDLRKVEGNPSIIDLYELGVEIANAVGPGIRGAAVARRRMVNYMGENTAVNRGAIFKVFTDVEEAMEWLGVQ